MPRPTVARMDRVALQTYRIAFQEFHKLAGAMQRIGVAAVASRRAAPVSRPPCGRLAAVRNVVKYRCKTRVKAIHAHTEAPAAATTLSRRRAAAAALLAAALPWVAPLLLNPSSASAAEAGSRAAEAGSGYSKPSFYAEWPYVTPSDILPYLRATATPGDIDSVLAAIDRFAEFYPMYR